MIQAVSLAVATVLLTTAAQAATIDFEAQTFDGFGCENYQSIEDGFRIDISPTSIFGMYLINDPSKNLGMCGPGCASNGTTAYYGLNETSVSFSHQDGSLFSLTSLDVAQTFLGLDRPLVLTLTGVQAGGGVTSTIFVGAEAAGAFSTFTFDNFMNLSSLSITGGQEFPEFALDNVVLSAAVPEPVSWAMMIGGFGIIGGVMRRRRPVNTTVSFA